MQITYFDHRLLVSAVFRAYKQQLKTNLLVSSVEQLHKEHLFPVTRHEMLDDGEKVRVWLMTGYDKENFVDMETKWFNKLPKIDLPDRFVEFSKDRVNPEGPPRN